MSLSPNSRYNFKVARNCALLIGLILPVERYLIDEYKEIQASTYHVMVQPTFTDQQYQIILQSANTWVHAVVERGGRLKISVSRGACPMDKKTICISPTPTKIVCDAVLQAMGCTDSSRLVVQIDTEFSPAATTNIAEHELGHTFGILDQDDCQGVMCRYVDVDKPRQLTSSDVDHFLKDR